MIKEYGFFDAKIILLVADAPALAELAGEIGLGRGIKLEEIIARIEEEISLHGGRKYKRRTILEREEKILLCKERIDNGKKKQHPKDRD